MRARARAKPDSKIRGRRLRKVVVVAVLRIDCAYKTDSLTSSSHRKLNPTQSNTQQILDPGRVEYQIMYLASIYTAH